MKNLNTFNQEYFKTIDPSALSPHVVKAAIKEITNIALQESGKPLKEVSVLDVGSGNGRYSFEIEQYVKKVTSIEPFKDAFQEAVEQKKRIRSKVKIYNVPIEKFKTREKYDLVLSLTTIEHMPKAKESFAQIFKLMKKGGVLYLTAPNRLWPYEHHYQLLFLSWLPLRLADFYVKITGKGESYEDSSYSKTYFGMKSFFNQFSCQYKFVLPCDKNSLYVGCGSSGSTYKLIKHLGFNLIRRFSFFWIFSKGFIMVIRKK